MKVYIIRKRGEINATAEYNPYTKECMVLAGSVLSSKIAVSEKFRGAHTIENARKGRVEKGVLKEDVVFKSASTAANFVTGSSTNGLITWKTEDGRTIKKTLEDDINE